MTFHESAVQSLRDLGPLETRIILAVSVLILGYLFMKVGISTLEGGMRRSRHFDDTLTHFVHAVLTTIGWIVILVVLFAVLGVPVAAMVGSLAIGGFIIGFALKDTLGNLAAGAMLLFYRPFNIGDWVTIGSADGEVTSLGMSMTILKAADGRLITMPNGSVLGGAIINHTRAPIRRADVLVGIAYGDDIDTAVRAIMSELPKDARVLKEPEMNVRITDLGDNGVGLQVRPWVDTAVFWQAQADFHGIVKRALEGAGCTIPFPQRDVYLHQETA